MIMPETVSIPNIYQHYKGDYYFVLGIAMDRERDVEMVVYYNTRGELQIRDFHEFFGKVNDKNMPDDEDNWVLRFKKIDMRNH